ncbi:DNA (cytosine-5)-methyltransferase 1 [Sphingobium faniae]|nr:DNA (cytosine-5)-methyltransferase 1 [Sphingobium faniae]
MSSSFKTVDLFAGPGGLAEGFSSVRRSGRRIFDIALSVEKEASAFRTLRLRAFTRQFDRPPEAYYRFISGQISREIMISLHPEEWAAAEQETAMLELGTQEAQAALDPELDRIGAGGDTILIGGPPCQAYSLVGRARNRGINGYDPTADHRHFLYREYIRILERLRPAVFVMENVKGILSSKVGGERIFERVLDDLVNAGGQPSSYKLVPLVSDRRGRFSEHIIRSENFGIPQRRHRVILLGVRSDRFDRIADLSSLTLSSFETPRRVSDVLEGMPPLRSGLSRQEDSFDMWLAAATNAFRTAAKACRADGSWLKDVARALDRRATALTETHAELPRSASEVSPIRDNWLGAWLTDRELLTLPNHESRGHMATDLARYAFAATFAEHFGRSPKAAEFPRDLAPSHQNWDSGKFADRFRVQLWAEPATTVTSHISKDGHYFIHPDPRQCRSLTVREAARLQTFPDNYFFEGNRTQQYVQVGNAVPPLLARQIAEVVARVLGVDTD